MRSTPGKTTVSAERERLRQLTATLGQNLETCAKEATVDAVHDVRTGTRRIEAMLDSILRERIAPGSAPGSEPAAALREAAQSWQALLKKIRRTAAAVRDLDVHRRLLEKQGLVKKEVESKADAESPVSAEGPDEASTGNASEPAYTVHQQAADLDAWLKHARQSHARPLMKAAPKWSARLEDALAAFEEAVGKVPRRRGARSAAVVALEAFARLATQMERLDAGNLHDFRKGAKKARYMAESGGEDPQAGAVGKALKRLQDEIGDWHDWLVLAEEAQFALGEKGAGLTALIETERDRHYALAMSITERMRGRLMGEWQALSPPRRIRVRRAEGAVSAVSQEKIS